MMRTSHGLLMGGVLLAAALPGLGGIANGGFDQAFGPDWESSGLSLRTAVPSWDGGQAAVLSSGFDGAGFGGESSASTIEGFLSLAPGTLDSLVANNGWLAVDGSAIKQCFAAAAGETLSFRWNFVTAEYPGDAYNDFAFVSLVNTNTTVEVLANLLDPSIFSEIDPGYDFAGGNSDFYFDQETGWMSFSYTFLEAGTYCLGLGVMDGDLDGIDGTINSGLLIDNVSLVIPAPRAVVLGLLGVGVMLVARRRVLAA